jgi:negative regulator of sigma-B (phosphoserine phosphatase)
VVRLEIVTAGRPCAGESESGDGVVYRQKDGLSVWAMIDALGHGSGAAQTANVALAYLQGAPLPTSALLLLEGLRSSLKNTRGAVALVTTIQEGELFGCGVGNISFRGSRPALSILSVAGVLGARSSSPKLFRCALQAGDRLALFSDGISGRFSWEELRTMTTADAARYVLEKYGHNHDDATISLAEVVG